MRIFKISLIIFINCFLFMSCISNRKISNEKYQMIDLPIQIVGVFESIDAEYFIRIIIDENNQYYTQVKQGTYLVDGIRGFVIEQENRYILNKFFSQEKIHPYSHIITSWNEYGFSLLHNSRNLIEFKKVPIEIIIQK